MIYLLGQMSFIILLAAIAGAALGWGFHRLRNNQTLADLRRVIVQQQQHVKQAHSEVSMLSQDYDELKQNSSSTIDTLRSENRQIPNLHQNLEKSQLLVRQLMQKHEAQIREYATENETLKTKLKHVDDREQALNKLQSDVERDRKDINNSRKASSDKDTSDDANASSDAKPSNAKSAPQTIAEITAQAQARAQANATKDRAQNNTDTDEEDQKLSITNGGDEDSVEALDMSADVSGEAGSLTVALAEADVVLAAIDKKREDSLTIADDEVIDTSESLEAMEFAGDEDDPDLLFDPVDQHDDLQTIFGIGPIFERSLNKLGITSYSQLAELKRHDIEKLAVALEIVPGKIERENWVGNARRQLEDVLEEL